MDASRLCFSPVVVLIAISLSMIAVSGTNAGSDSSSLKFKINGKWSDDSWYFSSGNMRQLVECIPPANCHPVKWDGMNSTGSSLKLPSAVLTDRDYRDYNCTADCGTSQLTRTFSIYRGADLSSTHERQYGVVGQNTTLECHGVGSGVLTFDWDSQVDSSRYTKNGSLLQIFHVSKADEGKLFTCVAHQSDNNRRNLADVVFPIYLTANFTPELPGNRTVTVTTDLLDCSDAQGEPAPHFTWTCYDAVIPGEESAIYNISTRAERCENYTCIASNLLGNASRTFVPERANNGTLSYMIQTGSGLTSTIIVSGTNSFAVQLCCQVSTLIAALWIVSFRFL